MPISRIFIDRLIQSLVNTFSVAYVSAILNILIMIFFSFHFISIILNPLFHSPSSLSGNQITGEGFRPLASNLMMSEALTTLKYVIYLILCI